MTKSLSKFQSKANRERPEQAAPTHYCLLISVSTYSLQSSQIIEASGSFCIPHVSFQRKRGSSNHLLAELDARLHGHDSKNSPTAQLISSLFTKNAPDTKRYDGADTALQHVRYNLGQRGFSVGDTEKPNGFGKQRIKKSFKDKVSGD